jgi:hypothetical protein
MNWNDGVNLYESEEEMAAYYFSEGIVEAQLRGLNEEDGLRYANAYVETVMRVTV